MAVFVNRVKVETATTGTGTITLGSADDGYQSFTDAGLSSGAFVSYVIEDGNDFEIGRGLFVEEIDPSLQTLTRNVKESSNSGAAIALTGGAKVFATALADDLYGYSSADISVDQTLAANVEYDAGSGTTILDGATLTIPATSRITFHPYSQKRPL